MKTYSIDIFLSTGMLIRLERLSKSKLDKFEAIIDTPQSERDYYRTFKHEGARHFFKPSEIAHYVYKKVIL